MDKSTNISETMDKISKRKTKRSKKNRRSWLIRLGIGAVALYFIITCIRGLFPGVVTYTALKGSLEESLDTDGYIFKQQYIESVPASGYFECMVDEGERVAQGQLIGYIFSNAPTSEQSENIKDVVSQINRLENSEEEEIYADNAEMVEQRISSAIRDVPKTREQHDMSLYADTREQIDDMVAKKRGIQGEKTDKETRLSELRTRLSQLENEVGGTKTEILAEQPGVYTSKIDGLEDVLAIDKIGSVTPGYLEDVPSPTSNTSAYVETGQPLFKIVDNYGWYYVTTLSEKDAKDLTIDQSVRLRFFDLSDYTIYATIKNISQPEGGKVAVSMYTNRYVDSIYSSNMVSADLVVSSYEGIKLPVKCLRVKDNQTGVYVVRLGVARFVPVTDLGRNEDWVIVQAVTDTNAEYKLQIYDEVIVDYKDVEDGKVVR